MKILKADRKSVQIEVGYDELGILHYAIYYYLLVIDAKIKGDKQFIYSRSKPKALINKIQNMAMIIECIPSV